LWSVQVRRTTRADLVKRLVAFAAAVGGLVAAGGWVVGSQSAARPRLAVPACGLTPCRSRPCSCGELRVP
jgi:hypothetical protein